MLEPEAHSEQSNNPDVEGSSSLSSVTSREVLNAQSASAQRESSPKIEGHLLRGASFAYDDIFAPDDAHRRSSLSERAKPST